MVNCRLLVHLLKLSEFIYYVERPKTYAKGPAVMSKSDRTKRRYAKDFKNQTRIDGYMTRLNDSSQIPVQTSEPTSSVELVKEAYIEVDKCNHLSNCDNTAVST